MATEDEPIATEETYTPMIAVLLGGGLTVLESIFDILNAELYVGEFGEVTVTETEIISITAIGLVLRYPVVWLY